MANGTGHKAIIIIGQMNNGARTGGGEGQEESPQNTGSS